MYIYLFLVPNRSCFPRSSSKHRSPMAAVEIPSNRRRSTVIWLHGLGDSGRANEPIKDRFTSSELGETKWLFPTAPSNPVTCNRGYVMHSWFDIHEMPITAKSRKEDEDVVKAVKRVHAMIVEEIASGTLPTNIFICGLSQGGALALATVMLYPGILGGGAVFSGWVPFNDSVSTKFPQAAKKTPILWCHGMLDHLVLFEAGETGHLYLRKAGFSCEFKNYPDLGHTLWDEELEYLQSWIVSHLGNGRKEEIMSSSIQKGKVSTCCSCIPLLKRKS